MRVLNVAYPLLPVSAGSAGGAEQILYLLDRGLAARGIESDVIAAEGEAERNSAKASRSIACEEHGELPNIRFAPLLHSIKSLPEDRQLLLFLRF